MSRNVPGNLRMNCQKQLTTATQQWLDNGWAIARISGFPSHASPWSVSSWELNSRIIGRMMTSGFLPQLPSHCMDGTHIPSHHFNCCWCYHYQQSWLKISRKTTICHWRHQRLVTVVGHIFLWDRWLVRWFPCRCCWPSSWHPCCQSLTDVVGDAASLAVYYKQITASQLKFT